MKRDHSGEEELNKRARVVTLLEPMTEDVVVTLLLRHLPITTLTRYNQMMGSGTETKNDVTMSVQALPKRAKIERILSKINDTQVQLLLEDIEDYINPDRKRVNGMRGL